MMQVGVFAQRRIKAWLTTLADPAVVEMLKKQYGDEGLALTADFATRGTEEGPLRDAGGLNQCVCKPQSTEDMTVSAY